MRIVNGVIAVAAANWGTASHIWRRQRGGFHETRDQIIVNNFAGDRDRPIAVPKPLFGAASSYLLEPRQPVERALQDKCRGVLVDDGGALLAADVRGNQITLNCGS